MRNFHINIPRINILLNKIGSDQNDLNCTDELVHWPINCQHSQKWVFHLCAKCYSMFHF